MNINCEIDFPRPAFDNMCRDEALFYEHDAARKQQIQLRFYSWRGPAITFGYAQLPNELIDLAAALNLGIETARRITGGGMVLHQPNELTYSLVAPLTALPQGIIPSCNFISEIFCKALWKIGVPAALAEKAGFTGDYDRNICFARPARYEVLVNGKKLLGSAQKRGRHSLLQHGSLALEPLLPVFAELLDITALKQHSTNIQECLTYTDKSMYKYTYKELAEIIREEFLQTFASV
ncbi:MAG: lipoate--protein ligase family protein [Candidatus Margulisbacteria bacterium]|jgi:lipoate-protein ligase A|nr:lipoate--protein ligase family protein [Candidatus Margulisiibacteriota bacterium]